MLRRKLSRKHPVIGEGYRLLQDDDVLEAGDQTARVSCLISYEGEPWISVLPQWNDDFGKTIRAVCEDGPDADGWERVFRRKVVTDARTNEAS